MLSNIALWIDERLHVSKLFASTAGHTVPASAGSWFYVFGSGTLLCFLIQIVTGICLAFVYVPSADEAYQSGVSELSTTLGWFRRAPLTGVELMVGIMAVHMAQVPLFGAYKYPRS
jgi:ubiquinol-cytochrome c reductase cytochrome b subunit